VRILEIERRIRRHSVECKSGIGCGLFVRQTAERMNEFAV